ncbi:MAG TPA: NADP-dependent oxidoreductase [Thermoplasmata archaeon]|nr:NADP-dependent oxidoreductase [Thermoplasmata archaeon]
MNRRWLVAQRVDGEVTEANFRWAESVVPALAEGQFLVHNLWLSFDPTQIFMIARGDPADPIEGGIPLGDVMSCIAVAEVVESRHPDFSPGDLVHGHMGWEDYTVTDGAGFTPTYRVPDGIPANWAIGALGLTGLVAYFGVHEVARPKLGETFVISGAAGGVGSIAAQLAKIYGLRVVGIAGSPAKCDWLLREAGVDGAINYRAEDVRRRLTELCPDGIDIFFDNDGGPTLDIALERLRSGGRVVLCGATSRYAAIPRPPGPANYLALVMVNGRMEGLLGRDYVPRRSEAFDAMLPLLRSGRLKSKEDVLEGLREAPKGLARLYSGTNVGKQLLRMDPSPGS